MPIYVHAFKVTNPAQEESSTALQYLKAHSKAYVTMCQPDQETSMYFALEGTETS